MSRASISPITSTCCASFFLGAGFVGSFLLIVMMPVPVVASALVSVIVVSVVAITVVSAMVVATAATSTVAMVVMMIVAARRFEVVSGARTSVFSAAFFILPQLCFQGRDTVSNISKSNFQVVKFGDDFGQ